MSEADLNALVTRSILRAERLADERSPEADMAYAQVSVYEEMLVECGVASDGMEADIARMGAVTAALRANQPERASSLVQRYLADPRTSDVCRREIADMLNRHEPKPSGASTPGILVAVEGIDGAGKTTQASRVAQAVRDAGYDVVTTREPTDGPWGRRIRASATAGRMTPEEELDAFLRDRVEHVGKVIGPSLAAGKIVIVDRYYFSSVAYQGARGMSPGYVQLCNEAIAPFPDLLVLLEIDARDAVSRVSARGESNLFEREDDLRRVAAIYATIKRPQPMRIDAMQDANDITSTIVSAVLELARTRGITSRR